MPVSEAGPMTSFDPMALGALLRVQHLVSTAVIAQLCLWGRKRGPVFGEWGSKKVGVEERSQVQVDFKATVK